MPKFSPVRFPTKEVKDQESRESRTDQAERSRSQKREKRVGHTSEKRPASQTTGKEERKRHKPSDKTATVSRVSFQPTRHSTPVRQERHLAGGSSDRPSEKRVVTRVGEETVETKPTRKVEVIKGARLVIRSESSESHTSTATSTVTSPGEGMEPSRRPRQAGKSWNCPVPDCHEVIWQQKIHAVKVHLPGVFDEKVPLCEDVTRKRLSALKLIAHWMLGSRSTVQNLATFVDSAEVLTTDNNREVTKDQTDAMAELCKEATLPIPRTFTLCPLSSPAALFHWRAMIFLIAQLEPRYRATLLEQFQWSDTESSEPQTAMEESSVPTFPKAFDSHFHLDRMRRASKTKLPNLEAAAKAVAADEPFQVDVIGATANFCDPETYPTMEEVQQLHSQNVAVCVGLHPKKAEQLTPKVKERLARLAQLPEVSGIGEIGLDYSTPVGTWFQQSTTLDEMLKLVDSQRVMVIHCRGTKGQNSDLPLHNVLKQAKCVLRREQKIHLHSFHGSPTLVRNWLEEFPNTYFGFTKLVDSMDKPELDALKTVPSDRILLETDAPYFPMRGGMSHSGPSLIGMVADIVAKRRGTTWKELLEVATTNAQLLYFGRGPE